MTRITSRPPPQVAAPSAKPTTTPAAATPSSTSATGWAPTGVKASAPVAAAPSASPAEVATAFYEAFQKQDVGAFAKLYAPEATFKDPIY